MKTSKVVITTLVVGAIGAGITAFAPGCSDGEGNNQPKTEYRQDKMDSEGKLVLDLIERMNRLEEHTAEIIIGGKKYDVEVGWSLETYGIRISGSDSNGVFRITLNKPEAADTLPAKTKIYVQHWDSEWTLQSADAVPLDSIDADGTIRKRINDILTATIANVQTRIDTREEERMRIAAEMDKMDAQIKEKNRIEARDAENLKIEKKRQELDKVRKSILEPDTSKTKGNGALFIKQNESRKWTAATKQFRNQPNFVARSRLPLKV